MNYLSFLTRRHKGFILPLTLIVCVIILTIATSISIILAKELYFSKLSRSSQVAYYAADSGLMCATMIDDQYVDPSTGSGIFQYNTLTTSQMVLDKINVTRVAQGLGVVTLNSIKCATSDIFDTSVSQFAVSSYSRVDDAGNPENGQTSTFNMKMDLGGGEFRCATVSVNKTPTFRQIISRGFATCDSVFSKPVERAIVSNSESVGISEAPVATATVLASGTSWTVPQNVTSIKVWVVGAGGRGGSAEAEEYSSGGGGAAGGVAYRQFSVTPGDVLSYSVGVSGMGGQNGTTQITVGGITIQGTEGFSGGMSTPWEPSLANSGGIGINGTVNISGGAGRVASSNEGGGGGGAIGGINGGYGGGCGGGNGGQAADIQGLFAVLVSLDIPTTSPGTGGACGVTASPTNATGFGSGGGGASGTGGANGADGLFGGGGGGATGSWGGNPGGGAKVGGYGGGGAVVISWGS